jgi:preprotein translocase subunit SecA
MTKMGAEEGEVITHPLITKSIGNAQKRVEMQNFEARKRLLDYDDVMNQQREVIYDLRTFALEGGEDLKTEAWNMIEKTLDRLVDESLPESTHVDEWDLPGLRERLLLDFFLSAEFLPASDEDDRRGFNHADEIREALEKLARAKFDAQLEQFGAHADSLLRYIVLSTIDERWKDHLYDLDHLKASIGFRGWGQKDPLIEYKKEAYDMFVDLLTDINSSVARLLFRARMEVGPPPPLQAPPLVARMPGRPAIRAGEVEAGGAAPAAEPPIVRSAEADAALALGVSPRSAVQPRVQELRTNREEESKPRQAAVAEKVGRNDPCPCGSGKKYKQCHGRR